MFEITFFTNPIQKLKISPSIQKQMGVNTPFHLLHKHIRVWVVSACVISLISSCTPNPQRDADEVCNCMHQINTSDANALVKVSQAKRCYTLYEALLKKYDNAAHIDAKKYVSLSRQCLAGEAFDALINK